MSEKYRCNWYSLLLWLALSICLAVMIGTAEPSYAANSAPVWSSGAITEDTATITKGNPYTPAEFITMKWSDPDGDALTYYYSIDDSEPELCADYIGAESQLQWFAYTFRKLGTFVLKVWASDGKLDSEPYVATVTVVDPATHEYTMTIKAAPRNVDLEFFTFEGYDEDGYDIPGTKLRATNKGRDDNYHTYEIKLKGGTYCFRGADTAGNDLGGMTFNVPNEANTAGASETGIIVRELDIACSTKYDGTNYCTADHFKPVISRSGRNSVLGDTYVLSGMTYFRTMVVASGNDMVYQHYLEATSEAEALGYTDGGANESFTPTAGSSAQKLELGLSRFWEATFNVPENSDVRIYFRRSYYSFIDKTEKRFISKVNNGDGTETWKFTVPNQTLTYSWRVSKEGRLTKAGFFSQTTKEIDLTGEDKASPKSTVTDVGTDYIDNSIMLNVNGQNALELSVGETFSLKAYRVWEIIKSSGGNDMIEPDFHTEIISGDDVIDVREETLGNAANNKAVITAKKEGLAIISVTYDALDIYGGESSGVYGACDEERKGIVAVKVGDKNTSDIKYHITGEASRKTEWDVEFDTCYFFGDIGTLKAAPETDGVITSVSIADPEVLEWIALSGEDGTYTIPVRPGNNLLRVITDSGETFYQMIRGCRYSTTVTNLSREGEEPAVGDTVKIHLDGLYMPVPKMSGVYNPGYGSTGRVIYQDEEGNTVEASGVQYDFIAKQDLSITIPEYSDGEYTLCDGHMFINIMGPPDPVGKHREIPDGGLNRMFNAVSRAWSGSALENIKIQIAETGKGLRFKDMLPSSLVELTDHNGTTLVPKYDVDEVLFEELPDGSYEYRVTLAGFQDVAGSIEIAESDSGFKEISIVQTANDPAVQMVIDGITALPDEDDLTEADIESVEAVKEAYDALSTEQQTLIRVELKEKLEKLLHAAAILSDEDVMSVLALIRALPDAQDLSLDDIDQIEQAEAAFNSLTEEQKTLVDEVYQRKLGNIVSRIAQLIAEKEDQDAANEAVSLIQGLPALEDLTLEDSEEVARVKSYYDSLTRAQKALVPDSIKLDLQDAVERIADLKNQAEEEERTREELRQAKIMAKEELAAYKDPALYRDAQKAELADAVARGSAAIDAAETKDDVTSALIAAKAEIEGIKTDVQLTEEENRTEEERKAALRKAKDDAKADLAAYKDPSLYREAQQEELANAVARGNAAIEAAETPEEVTAALLAAKAEISLIKTDAEITEEENQTEEERKAALEEARNEAKKSLSEYRDPSLYREAEQVILADAVRRGMEAIDAAADKTEVRAALESCITEIDLIRTDAEITEEERKAAEEEQKRKAEELARKIKKARAAKTKIKVKALKKHKAKITWNKLSAVTGYKIYRATKKTGKYRLIKTIKSRKTIKFINKKLKKGRKYFYKVRPYTRLSGKVYIGKWSNIIKIKAR